jgi:hypothetical protein
MVIVNLCFIKWEEIIHALTINYSTNKHVGLATYILKVLHAMVNMFCLHTCALKCFFNCGLTIMFSTPISSEVSFDGF